MQSVGLHGDDDDDIEFFFVYLHGKEKETYFKLQAHSACIQISTSAFGKSIGQQPYSHFV